MNFELLWFLLLEVCLSLLPFSVLLPHVWLIDQECPSLDLDPGFFILHLFLNEFYPGASSLSCSYTQFQLLVSASYTLLFCVGLGVIDFWTPGCDDQLDFIAG